MMGGRKLWMSPGAALGLVGVCCLFVLGMALVALPASQKAQRADTRNAALIAANKQSRANGFRLLHRFDCTYGRATILSAQNAEKTALRAALLAKRNARALRAKHLTASARVSEQNYRNQKRAADTYHELVSTLKPLGAPTPCP